MIVFDASALTDALVTGDARPAKAKNADDLVRRVEAGEQVTITVAGRPVAVLGPATSRVWRSWEDVAEAFDGVADPDWQTDVERLDGAERSG